MKVAIILQYRVHHLWLSLLTCLQLTSLKGKYKWGFKQSLMLIYHTQGDFF
jgi:hypothetical protein